MSTNGEVAFITGGGGAIGYGIAKACLERGWRVALVDISEEALATAIAKLDAPRDRLTGTRLDVSDPDAWEGAAEQAADSLGPVTHLFNNAGVQSARAAIAGGNIENLSVEEWRWTNSINYDGVFFGLKTFVPRFKKMSRATHIVNTASVGAVAPMKTTMPLSYPASKAAIAHMSAQLRTELAMQNVTTIGISVLYPGRVTSNMIRTSLVLGPGERNAAMEESDDARRPEGVDPELIGRFVLRAIDRGDFHIFTHPEWRENILAYRSEFDASFKDRADPSFDDPSTALVDISHAASKV